MPTTIDTTNEERIKEIKSILRSLLISNSQLDVTVQQLNRYYREMEGGNIPFREFQCNTLEDFLLQLPDTVQLHYNNQHKLCVKHVENEKSAHISSLIAKQKKPKLKRSKSLYQYKPRYTPQNYYKPIQSYNYSPATIHTLLQALQDLKRSPAYSTRTCALRKSEVMVKVKEKLGRYSTYSIQNLNSHLSELSYLLLVEGDFIYFKDDLAKSQASKNQESRAAEKSVATSYNNPVTYINKNEDVMYNHRNIDNKASNNTSNDYKESSSHITNNNNNVQKEIINYTQNNTVQKSSTDYTENYTRPRVLTNSIQNNNTIQEPIRQIQNNVNKKPTQQIHDEFNNNNIFNGNRISSTKSLNEVYTKSTECLSNGFDKKSQPDETNSSDVIKDRTKIRLQKLIEKHPEGIWCAELPSLYKTEYNVTLEYEEAGFNSITEFVAALPDIFHIVEPIPNTNRQMLLDAKNPEGKSNNSHQTKTLASLYNFDEYVAGEPEPIPYKLSSNVSQKLMPEGVMSYNETVDLLRVSSLIQDDYIEVVVSEIFTPSFFWIHLRKYKKKLKNMMESLDEFYTTEDLDKYKIPQILLQPGLNIACVYAKMWHRGIIKKIKPDGYIVIMFYDYGTVKTYHPDDLYYLNKKFSYLPAQAIACGLYNVKPAGGNIEWPQAATDEFNHRVWNVPLIAFICSTNEENNTMTVNLIDTSDDLTDFHVTDWMVENEFAQHGKMVCNKDNFIYKYYQECFEKKNSNVSNDQSTKKVANVKNVISPKLLTTPSENFISYDRRLADIRNYKTQSVSSSCSSLSDEIIYVFEEKRDLKKEQLNQKLFNRYKQLSVTKSSLSCVVNDEYNNVENEQCNVKTENDTIANLQSLLTTAKLKINQMIDNNNKNHFDDEFVQFSDILSVNGNFNSRKQIDWSLAIHNTN